MGSIYKRGNTYWIQYYKDGKRFQESTGSIKKMVAKKFLDIREGEIAQGKRPGIYFDKVTFDDLAKGLLSDYKLNGKRSIYRAENSIFHLKQFFEGDRVSGITSPRIGAYTEFRMKPVCRECEARFDPEEGIPANCPRCGADRRHIKKGASNASINRELSALKRMLNLGARQTPPIVDRVPYIPMLKESNTRKGFFEHGEFVALRKALPSYLRGFVTFAYKTGWRKSEIEKLTWKQVDRKQGIVRLEPGSTKNEDARTVYLDDELKDVVQTQWASRSNLLPFVFVNQDKTDRIKRFDKSWATACKSAKIGRRLFHDFRRTAVRNMVRSGIPERVAMMISGHKTRSVFDRYNIVSDADLIEAAKKQETYIHKKAMKAKVVNLKR